MEYYYIKELRIHKKLTQCAVSDRIGISQQMYSAIEHGERQRDISLDLLIKLSEVFGEPLDKLIEAERDYKASIAQ